jgi:hypothetical protein
MLAERWGHYGDLVAQRLQELDAVDRLGDLETLPYLRVAATREGHIVTVHDGNGVRIRLRPAVPRKAIPSLNAWRTSTAVVVLDVVVEP